MANILDPTFTFASHERMHLDQETKCWYRNYQPERNRIMDLDNNTLDKDFDHLYLRQIKALQAEIDGAKANEFLPTTVSEFLEAVLHGRRASFEQKMRASTLLSIMNVARKSEATRGGV